jgi:carbamoyl-phosphate synthase large subunit
VKTAHVHVLVTSAGTASAVSVIKALRLQKEIPVRIFAVDADASAPGLFLADEHALVGRCSDPGYIPELLQFCRQHRIDALFPIYSREIEVVANNSKEFGRIGIHPLVSPPEVVRRCNDKLGMYELVESLGIPVPRRLEWFRDPPSFPLYAKPNSGSGSSGVWRLEDIEDFRYVRAKHPDYILQEYLTGQEFTIDALCDRERNVVIASPRIRLAVKSGQCVKGRTVQEPFLEELSRRVCAAAGIVGPCNLQFIKRGNDFVFIELNPRYAAGGLMLTVRAGANLPLIALQIMLGASFTTPAVIPGVLMLRYREELIVQGEHRIQ